MTDTVTLRGVVKRFRGTTALDGVDLLLRTGVTGLLGPNGAGKTTLLRILATVLRADAGVVRVGGRDPYAGAVQRTKVRRALGYLPQELGFPNGFTGFAFLDYMAVLKEWTDRRSRHAEVRRVLDLVQLGDLGPKRLRALSGGQRRRVAIAQALIGDPDVLLLDEPTTGLDPEQRASLRRVLSVAGERSTVLLSTHQTEDVAALCDRVVVIDDGRIRFDGAVRELVDSAHGRVWLADAPDPAARASWRTGTGRHRNVGERAPADAQRTEPTLEDAYLLLLGDRARPMEVPA
jgi:ABC-2 type transport system ATP-binding protein